MKSLFEPTWESIDSHDTPTWYHDAKLGIFIHWGIYSVPAWAPTDVDVFESDIDSPYAEWYPYYMSVEESQTHTYHRETYGPDVEYLDFVHDWHAERWDPEEWARLFDRIGAGYVLLTGEHHDGFPLWETHYSRYNAASLGPQRDLVGDLCEAVRDRGLRFGASYHANLNYYQPGFDGLFGHPDYQAGSMHSDEIGPGPESVDFMNAKHRELIRRYEPDLLWFDVPKQDSAHLNAKEVIADYYNLANEWGKSVAVNDRSSTDARGVSIANEQIHFEPQQFHGDFSTPEYRQFDEIIDRKWEMCRGIGHSFGYNKQEGPEDYLTGTELVHLLIDIVSKNGNLLLNVGPRADGTIPERQRSALEALGQWLDTFGTTIFGTRPWLVPADHRCPAIRYTQKDNRLFAIHLGPIESPIELGLQPSVSPKSVSSVAVLGHRDIPFDATANKIRFEPREDMTNQVATAFELVGSWGTT